MSEAENLKREFAGLFDDAAAQHGRRVEAEFRERRSLDQLKAEFGEVFDAVWDQYRTLEAPDLQALARETGLPLVKVRMLVEALEDRAAELERPG